MKEQALIYVRLALSRNLTLKNVVFSPDADGLRDLVKTCNSAYNTAPNSEETFSAHEAKGLIEYAICVLESDSEAEKAMIRNRMKIGLTGAVEDCIRSLEYKNPKRNAQKIAEEKDEIVYLMRAELKGNVENSLRWLEGTHNSAQRIENEKVLLRILGS